MGGLRKVEVKSKNMMSVIVAISKAAASLIPVKDDNPTNVEHYNPTSVKDYNPNSYGESVELIQQKSSSNKNKKRNILITGLVTMVFIYISYILNKKISLGPRFKRTKLVFLIAFIKNKLVDGELCLKEYGRDSAQFEKFQLDVSWYMTKAIKSAYELFYYMDDFEPEGYEEELNTMRRLNFVWSLKLFTIFLYVIHHNFLSFFNRKEDVYRYKKIDIDMFRQIYDFILFCYKRFNESKGGWQKELADRINKKFFNEDNFEESYPELFKLYKKREEDWKKKKNSLCVHK